ncbi:MAG: DUF1413 domain-containing protein [Culicoidibacterales bacterium]
MTVIYEAESRKGRQKRLKRIVRDMTRVGRNLEDGKKFTIDKLYDGKWNALPEHDRMEIGRIFKFRCEKGFTKKIILLPKKNAKGFVQYQKNAEKYKLQKEEKKLLELAIRGIKFAPIGKTITIKDLLGKVFWDELSTKARTSITKLFEIEATAGNIQGIKVISPKKYQKI